MDSSPPTSFLKMEDLHNTPPPTPAALSRSLDAGEMTATPPPVIVHSKQAKKRKSWGQELPEPKTALPPRKRAKTDDEKEQRRIERIKRNRAAAHNSRERKRQETETLAVALARANAELDAYRKHFGALPANVVLPEVTLSIDSADTPAPSLIESSRGSIDAGASPATPADDDDLFDCPTIKEEPSETSFPEIIPSPAFDNLDAKSALPQLDPTQHSAVSVDCTEKQQQPQQLDVFQPFNFLVDQSLPLPHDLAAPDYLQNAPLGSLDPFTFASNAFDGSFNAPLDFSFEEFIHDDAAATVAVDPGFGAA